MSIQDFQVLQRGADGKAQDLSTGGPYTIEGAKDVLVGDLWVLAGQSNMEGVGNMADVETSSPWVHSYQSREEWAVAEEPLHWLDESPRFVHHQLRGRETMPEQPDPRDPNHQKGAGCGLTFGKTYHALNGVPVGLIPSAHGGTSMEQWNPARKNEGGGSLYGATYERIQAVGGQVAGILWYQGESDAYPEGVARYTECMTGLIQAFRSDLGAPNLPFLLVQLGCFSVAPNADMVAGWNGIREAQRRLAQTVPHVRVVSAIDLDLDDGIHIGTQGLKRLGRRLALAATGQAAPDFASVSWEANGSVLRVTARDARGGLRSAGYPAGFSLRNAEGRKDHRIYKVTLDGDSALLHLDMGIGPLAPDTRLWYGHGLHPYCNITDAEDQSLPAFGPIEIGHP